MPPAPAERAWTVALRQKEKSELEIAIYDVIGQSLFGDGISAKDVLGRLRAAPAVQRISIRINSNGGLLDDAKAMINLLAERRSAGVFVEATIDGMAASAASYLTTVADRVVMPSNAFLMFHQARAGVFGDAGKFETLAKYLRTSNEQLAEAYAAASSRRGKTRSKDDYLAEFAKGDRYLTADEAIEWGLADERTEPIQVAACLADISSLESVPDALRSAPYVVAAGARLPNAVPNLPPLPATPASGDHARARGQGTTMPETESEERKPAVEQAASVTLSGVKLVGVSTEAEAHARINDLNKLSIALLGLTGKATHAEALVQVTAWKTGSDQATALAAKVTELEGAAKNARRDAAIEKLSRQGRLPPAAHEWARINFATAEALETFALTLPPMASLGPREPVDPNQDVTLTAEEIEICRLTGCSHEDFLSAKRLERDKQRSRAPESRI